MSRYVNDRHSPTPDFYLHAIQQGKVGFKAKCHCILQMDTGGCARDALDLREGTTVITVTMGQEYAADLILSQRGENLVRICAGIHNGHLSSSGATEHIAVHWPGANL
jgi:hypothetical protein